MVTDAGFSDIDKDNDEDLVIVGEWMKVKILENIGFVLKFACKICMIRNKVITHLSHFLVIHAKRNSNKHKDSVFFALFL